MRRTRVSVLGATASACLLALVACSGNKDPDEAEVKEDMVEVLQRGDSTLDDEAAECFAELVIEEVGLEELNDLDLSADAPEELEDEIATAAERSLEECDSRG